MPLKRLIPCAFFVLAAALWVPLAQADDLTDVQDLLKGGRTAEALAKAEQVLAARPRDAQMRFVRGVILSETGRKDEAQAVFLQLTREFPELPEPHNNLAVLYAAQNQLDKAREELEAALRSNPGYATAHENLGDVYVRMANDAYRRASELNPLNVGLDPKLRLSRELLQALQTPQPVRPAR